MDDLSMVSKSQSILDLFKEHRNDFTSRYTIFQLPFETELQQKIDACNIINTDKAFLLKQQGLTENVEVAMGTGRNKLQGMSLYLKMAFPKNNAKYKQFGLNLYQKQRASQEKLPKLLIQAYNMCSLTANKALLIAKGTTQAEIDGLKIAADNIDTAKEIQNDKVGTRGLSTEDRINNLNSIWTDTSMISKSSKIIYEENPKLRKLFKLYKNKKKDTNKEEKDFLKDNDISKDDSYESREDFDA